MITPGRPPKGYSDYENIFFLLREELNIIVATLENNVFEIEKKYLDKKIEFADIESEYFEKVKELERIFIIRGEEPEIANSMAKGDALPILKMDFDSFEQKIENQEIINKQTIDNLNKSSIVMMYSIIEYNLIKIVEILLVRSGCRSAFKVAKNKGIIGSCFDYFENKFKICYEKKAYIIFQKFQKVRNTIIHDNCSLDKEVVYNLLNAFESSILIEDEKFIFINVEFVKGFHNIVTQLLKSVEIGIGIKDKTK